MQCPGFRRTVGADPVHLDAEARAHAESCPACAAFRREALAFDARILAALRVQVPGQARGDARPGVGRVPPIDRRRWLALAASIAGGVAIGSLLWLGSPRDTLAVDLVEHMDHEPGAMVATGRPTDPAQLAAVLARGGIRLRPGVGTVSFANSCPFRGRTVPHLVVQTDQGPVAVMVLRWEPVAAPVHFAEQGYAGTLVPAGPGSIAVIGSDGVDLGQVARRVRESVEWLTG